MKAKKCVCGGKGVLKKFPFGYVIECNKNGHIHNTGFCETVKQAYDKWNDHPTEKGCGSDG